VLGIATVIVYCNLGITPLWLVILVNVVLFTAITGRMISSQALASAVPDMRDRGAFMSVNNSVAQISGGIAASIAGMIVFQASPESPLEHYDTLGWVVSGAMVLTIFLMYPIHRLVMKKEAAGKAAGAGTGTPAASTEARRP
jgi:predicted MFS family arabinose efflux permease